MRGYLLARRFRKAPRHRIEAHQRIALRRLLDDVSQCSPYYRSFRTAPLDPLPLLHKSTFLERFDEINSVGLNLARCEQHALKAEVERDFSPDIRGVTVGLSSGTSARRGVFLVSAEEKAAWAGFIIAKNIPPSFHRRKVALLLRANSNLYEASRGLVVAFRFFDLTRSIHDLVESLNAYRPDILIAPANVLDSLVDAPVTFRPEKVISVAEVLEERARARLEDRFGIRIDEIYQATEGYIASTCRAGNLHLNEETMIVEKDWVDRASGRFMPVITDLNRRTLPIIRYRLDDILVADDRPCACGSNMTRLARIEGRMDDVIWLPLKQGGALSPVFPDIVRRAMYLCEPAVGDYRIVQTGMTLTVHCREEDMPDMEAPIRRSLLSLCASLDVESPRFRFQCIVEQPKQQKFRRIACERKPDGESHP